MLASLVDGVFLVGSVTRADGALDSTPWYWWVIGFGGQLVFASRFWVQWMASERAKRSVMPISFWYLSIVGGLLSLGYAIYRLDPVFILGQLTGTFIYVRNLALIRQAREGAAG